MYHNNNKRMDYFKVIYLKALQEVEPVPHLWEEKGRCWFPKNKKDIKLFQCDPTKSPDKENWPSYSCVLKTPARPVWDWVEANKLANEMCKDNTSSEASCVSDEELSPHTKRLKKAPRRYADEFVYEFPNSPDHVSVKDKVGQENNDKVHKEIMNEGVDNVTLINQGTEPLDIASASDIEQLGNTIKDYQSQVNEIKSDIVNDIKLYFNEKFLSLSLQVDNIQKAVSKKDINSSPKEETEEIDFFPLNSKIEIESFEKKLEDEGWQKKIITYLRKVIGTGYSWRQASYKLATFLFSKKVLTEYSWTGVSRSNTMKEPFNKLNNVLAVFYHVVHFSDGTFTYSLREVFFRDGILKHSQSRLSGKKKEKALESINNGTGSEDGSNSEGLEEDPSRDISDAQEEMQINSILNEHTV